MILEDIVSVKDIFYTFTEFINYDEWISMSMINKSFHENMKKYRKIEYFKSRFTKKFFERKPVIYNIRNENDFECLMNDKNIIYLNLYLFRDLYLKHNLHTGDIIMYYQNKYILDLDKIYHTLGWISDSFEIFIPKIVQKKFGLDRWLALNTVNAFVKICLEDFDFDTFESIDTYYVKIWNTRHKIFIYAWVWHLMFDLISREDLIQITKNKIQDIIEMHKISNRQYNSFFYEPDDIKIFKWARGWFLE